MKEQPLSILSSFYNCVTSQIYNKFAAFSLKLFPLIIDNVKICPTPAKKTTLLKFAIPSLSNIVSIKKL